MNGPPVTVSPQDYDAVLFDLDGVLTQCTDTWPSDLRRHLLRRLQRASEWLRSRTDPATIAATAEHQPSRVRRNPTTPGLS